MFLFVFGRIFLTLTFLCCVSNAQIAVTHTVNGVAGDVVTLTPLFSGLEWTGEQPVSVTLEITSATQGNSQGIRYTKCSGTPVTEVFSTLATCNMGGRDPAGATSALADSEMEFGQVVGGTSYNYTATLFVTSSPFTSTGTVTVLPPSPPPSPSPSSSPSLPSTVESLLMITTFSSPEDCTEDNSSSMRSVSVGCNDASSPLPFFDPQVNGTYSSTSSSCAENDLVYFLSCPNVCPIGNKTVGCVLTNTTQDTCVTSVKDSKAYKFECMDPSISGVLPLTPPTIFVAAAILVTLAIFTTGF